MAINTTYTATGSQKSDPPQRAFGKIVYTSAGITAADYTLVAVGFVPRRIVWTDATNLTRYEWLEGMAANSCLKNVTAGDLTLEVTGGNGGITVCDSDSVATANTTGRSFKVLQNATLAAVLASATVYWYAEG